MDRLSVPNGDSALESLWLSVGSVTTVTIGVIYRLPSASDGAVLDYLQNLVTHVLSTDKPIYSGAGTGGGLAGAESLQVFWLGGS